MGVYLNNNTEHTSSFVPYGSIAETLGISSDEWAGVLDETPDHADAANSIAGGEYDYSDSPKYDEYGQYTDIDTFVIKLTDSEGNEKDLRF